MAVHRLARPIMILAVLVASACADDAAVTQSEPEAIEETAEAVEETTDVVEETADDDHEHDDTTHTHAANGIDTSLFFDGALTDEATLVDCTLSDGSASTCVELTVAGYPVDEGVGDFCPTTVDATADEVGIWFDGDGVYDLDGEFILGLAELYDDDNWQLSNDDGTVNVTETQEAFEAAARPDVDPEYQNHCVEGQLAWLPDGEPITSTVTIPLEPVLADNASDAGRGNLGVTLNGVFIANAAPVDAILSAYTIAAFDDCGGHINPFDGYHLHGQTDCGEVEVDDHESLIGYALDGFAIYDTTDDSDLDACGGHSDDVRGYHYHAAATEANAVISCFAGETVR